ncbi:peptide-methionine (S)-S-oxide reductase [Macrococcoides caseolyticum]|uniref:peptide-methionine (S)-S-oxide reductase n=1 Tax=Macrococcoides caseolyticum TaxID=69966 RepID=UPI001F46885C|nr:peptide-methionine (S)-S-oxide reductase [Macrococcus caseolyticus]MCE4957381.1 peptide-methionine (S)-S-oxide reductase [Macrococcus caseolyticus]
MSKEIIYMAGGCLWGVQAFMKTVPGVVLTEAGRANGTTNTLDGDYDGYAECVKVTFDSNKTSVTKLMEDFFLIIDPYSLNQQGIDVGEKYRTGVYSKNPKHLEQAEVFINNRTDKDKIMIEVKPLTNYVRSADEHQDYLDRHPDDYCHIPNDLMRKYK